MWSWISRGMVTMEQIAAWHFNNDVDAAETAMSRTRAGMTKLYSLDEVPDHHCQDPEAAGNDEEDNRPLQGESVTFWAIADASLSDPTPIPLPSWFRLPIDNVILTWKREKDIWNKRLETRRNQGKLELAPKAKQAHEAWKSMPERVLVLDKQKQAVVKNPEKKKQSCSEENMPGFDHTSI